MPHDGSSTDEESQSRDGARHTTETDSAAASTDNSKRAGDSGDVDAARSRDWNGAPWLLLAYTAEANSGPHVQRDDAVPVAGDFSMARTRVGSVHERVAASDDAAHLNDLADLNDGVGESDRSEFVRRESARRDIEIICDRLGATDFQHERAQYIFETVDLKADVIPSGPIEVALLAIVSVAIDEDRTRISRADTTSMLGTVVAEDRFSEVCEDYGIDTARVRQARRRLVQSDDYESPN